MLPITQEVAIFKKTRERLLVEFPDIDEQTLADTLEGMTTLQDMLSAVIRSELDDRAMAEALKSRIADMSSRFDRLDARIRKKRELVLNVMSEAELTKLTEADFTASLRIGRAPLRVRVRAGETTVTREGSGFGFGTGSNPGEAHEGAVKEAETDAMKRALVTFGNPFGLALYDRTLASVRGRPRATVGHSVEWRFRSADGAAIRLTSAQWPCGHV